jgi:uncharacterized protein YqfA (UPF0365 family)
VASFRPFLKNIMIPQLFVYAIFAIALLVALTIVVVLINFFGTWLRAKLAGAAVSFGNLIGMRLRRVPIGLIVDNRITAVKAGIDLDTDPLEAHYLAGGNVSHVVLALIAAAKAGISLDFDRACAIDLAIKGTSKTVLEAVRTSINPKVIDCPNPSSGKTTIDAVARDGIGVKARARVTVRSNLNRFVGGATEDTIIARVGEGIITSIPARPLKFFPSILPTSISATTSARNFKPSRPKPTRWSRRPRPKCAAPPLSPPSRK